MLKNNKLIIIIGTLLVLCYIIRNSLINQLWILAIIPFAILGITFFIVFIKSIIQNKKQPILIGLFTILALIFIDSLSWEVFKSKKVFEATLKDDLSGINMVLRKNIFFEVKSYHMFGETKFEGYYKTQGNQIIFLDQPYDNALIPDTLTIIGGKLILNFDEFGKPITHFASFFKIKMNQLNE